MRLVWTTDPHLNHVPVQAWDRWVDLILSHRPDGIVITGDLRKTEGTPLKIGQTMFEIGPLDEMIVEVAVPERDVLHVEPGMDVQSSCWRKLSQ